MSSPGCQRAPSRPNGDVIVPCAGHCSDTCQPASVWAAAVAGKRNAAISAAQSARLMAAEGSRRAGSEDLGAPGVPVPAEERVRARRRAVLELLGATGTAQSGERDTAEVGGAERLRRQRNVRIVVGARRRPVLELPPSLVPRAELVVHVEDDGPLRAVLPRGQRSPDVDEADPEPVTHAVAQTTRSREQQEQRVVGRQQERAHLRLPVDRKQITPQVALGCGRRGKRLDDDELPVARAVLETELVPIARVRVDRPVAFVCDPTLWPGPVAALFGIGDLAVLPPEVAPREHPGPLLPDAFVHRGHRLPRLLRLEETDRPFGLERLRERRVLVRELDLAAEGCDAVAETSVDRLLRRPESCERLAALVRVVELSPHERAQDAAPAVCRIHAHDAHARGRDVSAGDAEVELECTRAADDGAVRPRGVHPLGSDLVEEALHALLRRRHAEVLADREHRRGELVQIGDGADVEGHQKSSGQYGARSVRNSASARASAPSFSSRTRSAAARRVNENAPRYAEARSATSSSSSASSSVRTTSRPTRQRPAFHGQNSSRTPITIASSLAYDRPASAAQTSTSRSHNPSVTCSWRLRASTTIRSRGDAGSTRPFTRSIRSIPNTNRQSSRSASGPTAIVSTSLTELREKPRCQSCLMR